MLTLGKRKTISYASQGQLREALSNRSQSLERKVQYHIVEIVTIRKKKFKSAAIIAPCYLHNLLLFL